jgi:conjugal transfer pilin signal peptidase TrbI
MGQDFTTMLDRLFNHFRQKATIYLWALVAVAAFARYFTLTINISNSLPGTIFLVHKGSKPEKGDLTAFRYAGGGPYERGTLFLKQMVGIPGSTVVANDAGNGYRDYFVDGKPVGRAKPLSSAGMPLAPGPAGLIPEGRYYLAAPNPDSLDSRYALVGWVADDQIVGRAYRIF